MKKHTVIYRSAFRKALTAHLIGKQIAFGIYIDDERNAINRSITPWTIDGVRLEIQVFGLACSIKTRRLYHPAVIRRVF
jgi:hypothetical protein